MFYIPLRIITKGVTFTLHILIAFLISLFAPFVLGRLWHQTAKGKSACMWWFVRASNILNIIIHQNGYPHKTTTLYTANHISFLDIIVLAAVMPVKFLSKETLRYWPIIGFITSSAGTVFIKRGNRHIMHKVIYAIENTLQQEHSLVIFPEGTTTLGNNVKKFNTGIFQAAINSGKPIQPIALRYIRNGKPDRIAAYINNDNFITTLIRIMAQDKVEVQLTYCAAFESNTGTRAELAKSSHSIICNIIHNH